MRRRLSRGHELDAAMRLPKAARSRHSGLHARPELPAFAPGVAPHVPGLRKSPRHGRVRTADEQASCVADDAEPRISGCSKLRLSERVILERGVLTPFELALRRELEGEFVRMDSEWFFRWHNINNQGMSVDVDNFYGGRIRVGGIVFQGQVQSIYWRSVERYLIEFAHQQFRRWRENVEQYARDIQERSLEGTAGQLRTFSSRICQHAIDTDRRLRGRGQPQKVEPYNASGVQSASNAEIERLRQAYSALLADAALVARDASKNSFPASDRVVRIDHNSADFRDALSKLGQVIDALRSNNEYAASDPEEHEQRIAELEGGSRLLQAVRIRLAAAVTVLIVPLRWLAIKFADNLINALITAAIGALLLLLGIHLSS